jgi:hypothetical protein
MEVAYPGVGLLNHGPTGDVGSGRWRLEPASRAARFWPEEASQLVDAGRSLTELRAVGPWVAAKIHGWLDDPPPVPEPEEKRRGSSRTPRSGGVEEEGSGIPRERILNHRSVEFVRSWAQAMPATVHDRS